MTTTTETSTGDLLQQALEKLATADPNTVEASCEKLCLVFRAEKPWAPNSQQLELFLDFVEKQVHSAKVPTGRIEISTESHQALQRASSVVGVIIEAQKVFVNNGRGFNSSETWRRRLGALSDKVDLFRGKSVAADQQLKGKLIVCRNTFELLTSADNDNTRYLARLLGLGRE